MKGLFGWLGDSTTFQDSTTRTAVFLQTEQQTCFILERLAAKHYVTPVMVIWSPCCEGGVKTAVFLLLANLMSLCYPPHMMLLGTVGMGLMWGWLVALVSRPPVKRPFLQAFILVLVTALPAWQTIWFYGIPGLVSFLLAAIIATSVHIGWQQQLTNQP